MASEAYSGRKFKTEFLSGGYEAGEKAAELVKASKKIYLAGMGSGNEGNISVREKDGMLIKAGGVSLGKMGPDDVVYVAGYGLDENRASVRGRKEPSSETPMHWLIYKRYPWVMAVIHAHDRHVLKNPKDLPKTGEGLGYGTIEQAEAVVKELGHGRYVVIAGHGSVCVGEDLKSALDLVFSVHREALG